MPSKKEDRTPIVTILGHVDHGKTSILDRIRNTNVQSKEAGGITQGVSVFSVQLADKKDLIPEITFVDTPGHESFDLMRSRGGSIADIVLLVVAADDGIKPQTKESIEIINAAEAKPIVVINKIDLPNIDIPKVKRDLAAAGISVEGMGGKIPVVEVSAKTGKGIDTLLETISATAEVEGLVDHGKLANGVKGRAYVLESVKDNSKGFLTSIVMTQGEMSIGDWVAYVSGNKVVLDRIKGLISDSMNINEPFVSGTGGEVLGISGMAPLGTEIISLESKNLKLVEEILLPENAAKKEIPVEDAVEKETAEDSEEDQNAALLSAIFGSGSKEDLEGGNLNVILKASSEGALEAIKSSLEKLEVDGFKVNFISTEVGNITHKDIESAAVTKAIILGFEVEVDPTAKSDMDRKRVLVRTYDIIYKLIDEVNDALTALAAPEEAEEDLGSAKLMQIFVLSDGSKVLGGRVADGKIKRGEKCYIVRDDDIIAEGRITSLRENKRQINEALKGTEFGAIVEPTPDIVQEGDFLHCFKVTKL
ncbi:GTP-binding protein [Candidatus Dojkabacteria bacterium]|uniref:GTP-binding protein n=1 Tax=Candidatus Dojkabacteria bacterium TaxID=2099670 RepID=A0A955KWL6_9BACT|nr:GTP-binding protein [Candidatus Dojkabacteria bacterium]MCB9790835.1 GTP-binding protein [Candidatus Nomurabacteria bacterium]